MRSRGLAPRGHMGIIGCVLLPTDRITMPPSKSIMNPSKLGNARVSNEEHQDARAAHLIDMLGVL